MITLFVVPSLSSLFFREGRAREVLENEDEDLGRAMRRRIHAVCMGHELWPCVIVYDEDTTRKPSETTEIR